MVAPFTYLKGAVLSSVLVQLKESVYPCPSNVEGDLATVHAVAERLPVGFRADTDVLCPCRHGRHEDKQEEAEPLNDFFCFHS